MKQLWEILVPTMFMDERPVKVKHHKVWDKKVMEISGGLTIVKPAIGSWTAPSGAVYTERMIPVRIACTREQMEEIVQITIEHYEQLAVMAYKISNEVILSEATIDQKEKWKTKDKLGMKTYNWLEE